MRKSILVMSVAVIVAACLSGCREDVAPSQLDQFISRTTQLEGEALSDTLLNWVAAGEAPDDMYANYLLGNIVYAAASDSAASVGWGDHGVSTLLDSAEVYFSAAVAQDSTFIEALVNLGSLWDDRAEQMGSRVERDNRLATAERFYRRALAVDATDEKARCNLGSLYLRQRRVQDALGEFNTVIENDPHSALAHYNIAIMFAEQKIYRESIREWELAAKYDADGDIGERSEANVKIVKELMTAPDPSVVK